MISMRDVIGIFCFLISSSLWLALVRHGWKHINYLESMRCFYADPKRQRCRHRELIVEKVSVEERCQQQARTIELRDDSLSLMTSELRELRRVINDELPRTHNR